MKGLPFFLFKYMKTYAEIKKRNLTEYELDELYDELDAEMPNENKTANIEPIENYPILEEVFPEFDNKFYKNNEINKENKSKR